MIFVHFKYQSTSSKVKGSSFCFRLSSISSFICCTLHSFSFLNSSFLLVLAQTVSLLIFLMAKASFLIFLKSKSSSESRSFWVWCRVNKIDAASKLCLDLRWWSIVKITRKLARGYFHSTVMMAWILMRIIVTPYDLLQQTDYVQFPKLGQLSRFHMDIDTRQSIMQMSRFDLIYFIYRWLFELELVRRSLSIQQLCVHITEEFFQIAICVVFVEMLLPWYF